MRILVTGGAGFIGSHTVCSLLDNNHEVIIIDNLCNSQKNVIDTIKQITKKDVEFYQGDLRDKKILDNIFANHKIDAVIHFAGLKAVGESVEKPLLYYDNNLISTINLLEIMQKNNCKKLVFSSSATVYGNPESLPIKENSKLSPTNPYGTTKLMIENILKDLVNADDTWSIAILRYFNPIGAHSSGLLGENPSGLPNNLMPYIIKVATKKLPHVNVFGNDYKTKDGTGVRDYIHVVDLAEGHLCALKYINQATGIDYFNLGTGKSYSVLELIETFKRVNNVEVPYIISPRRPGDIAACYADSSYVHKKLGWQAKKNLKEMCKDSYNYVLKNSKNNRE